TEERSVFWLLRDVGATDTLYRVLGVAIAFGAPYLARSGLGLNSAKKKQNNALRDALRVAALAWLASQSVTGCADGDEDDALFDGSAGAAGGRAGAGATGGVGGAAGAPGTEGESGGAAGAPSDTRRDRENCGECGKSCDAGYVCNAGTCSLSC